MNEKNTEDNAQNNDTEKTWIDAAEVRRRYQLTTEQLHTRIAFQTFPAPIAINGKKRWLAETLRKHDLAIANLAHKNVVDGYASFEHVTSRYSVSKRTIQHWVKNKKFPPPYKRGSQSFWSLKDLAEYDDNGFIYKAKRGRPRNG